MTLYYAEPARNDHWCRNPAQVSGRVGPDGVKTGSVGAPTKAASGDPALKSAASFLPFRCICKTGRKPVLQRKKKRRPVPQRPYSQFSKKRGNQGRTSPKFERQ